MLPGVFTNPLHSLEGLEEFSHIWLIYHFHKNEPHTKAKISPPRLEGEKVGVFCTRSPHRPNPIGISLVQLEKVEGSSIFFLGTDMVNDTPVLDIKPYIPQYDNPAAVIEVENFAVAQRREEPEGEETVSQQQQNSSVRVPQWVSNKKELIVEFNETALGQLASLHIDKVCFNFVRCKRFKYREINFLGRYHTNSAIRSAQCLFKIKVQFSNLHVPASRKQCNLQI